MEAKILREVLVEAERQAHKAKYASSAHSWRAAVIQIVRALQEAVAKAESEVLAVPLAELAAPTEPDGWGDPSVLFVAPCGFVAKSAGGLGAHKFRCATCQAVEARA